MGTYMLADVVWLDPTAGVSTLGECAILLDDGAHWRNRVFPYLDVLEAPEFVVVLVGERVHNEAVVPHKVDPGRAWVKVRLIGVKVRLGQGLGIEIG